jgi:hypothetical protein
MKQITSTSYEFTKINIYKTSNPNPSRSFKIPDANHKPEKIAKKAIEKVLGIPETQTLIDENNRATITNDTLINDMKRNNSTGVPRCKDQYYLETLDFVSAQINNKEPFKTVHFTGTRFYDLNNSGSAELPYVTDPHFKEYIQRKYKAKEIENNRLTKGNGKNYILTKERVKVHQIKDEIFPKEKFFQDIRMHARSYITHYSKLQKVRAVYGVCMTLILIEIMLLWPLMAHMMKNSFIAWGYETFNGGLQKLANEVINYDVHFSTDFSTFDKLVPFWLIDDVHSIWKSHSDLSSYYVDDPKYPNPKAVPKRTENLWTFMNYAFKNMSYLAPDGSRYKRRHSGIPSGFLQTSILDSFVNAIMVLSALRSIGIPFSDIHFKVLGDDGHFSIRIHNHHPKEILERISAYMSKHFNAKLNPDKCHVSFGADKIQFLSYRLFKGAVRRVTDDLFLKLLYPENAHFDIQTTKSRALGIIVANLGYCPLVHAACQDILEYLNSVEYTAKGLNYYDRLQLEQIIKIFKQYPSREQLFQISRTVQHNEGDINFKKYIH